MSLFSSDSKLYKGLVWFTHVLAVNFLWILFSLPVITIGASTAAAYKVVFKLIDGTEGYIFRDFWKGFKENLKNGTILWIIFAAVSYGLYLYFQFLVNGAPSVVLIIISILGILIIYLTLLLIFPLCARYENSFFMHMRNSFILSTRYYKKTIFLTVILAAELAFIFWSYRTFIFLLILGPALIIFTVGGTARKIFYDIDKINKDLAEKKDNEPAAEILDESVINRNAAANDEEKNNEE